MGKIEHKNGQVGSGIALNMIKANSSAPFELGGQKGVGKNHMEGPLLQGGSRLKTKILDLSNKQKGLYNAVIEGHGQNEHTTGDYDADRQKLYKVEDKLENKLGRWKKRFGEDFSDWDDAPNMEGPLNKQTRFDKTISKAEEALEKGNYRKAFKKGKSLFRQADRQGLINKEDYEKVNFKTWKSDQGLSMKGPLKRTTDVDYSERTNRQAKRLGKLDAKREEGKRKGSDKRRKNLASKLDKSLKGQDFHTRRQANQAYDEGGVSMKGPLNKGCAKSDGGPGCVQKRGDEYVIINNKKPGNQIWRSGFPSRKAANDNLAGYHASK